VQSLQLPLPCWSWYLPGVHGKHIPLDEYVPVGQSAVRNRHITLITDQHGTIEALTPTQ
jgi:hypothetical protein